MGCIVAELATFLLDGCGFASTGIERSVKKVKTFDCNFSSISM